MPPELADVPVSELEWPLESTLPRVNTDLVKPDLRSWTDLNKAVPPTFSEKERLRSFLCGPPVPVESATIRELRGASEEVLLLVDMEAFFVFENKLNDLVFFKPSAPITGVETDEGKTPAVGLCCNAVPVVFMPVTCLQNVAMAR
jgi:hypothetical protein